MNLLPTITAMLCAAAPVAAQAPADQPQAQALLDGVIARLPPEPLRMTGDLVVRQRRGVVVREFGFALAVNWGSEPAVATYTLRDAFGGDLEQLTITRAAGSDPRFAYAAGQPLAPRPPPDLFAPILDSDISWMDLGLSFLWWKGGTVARTDEVLGRACYVVEVPAPPAARGAAAGGAAANAPASHLYRRVRLWIDKELNVMLQAEGLGADGRVIRRLWVKSFKKINNQWMVKDLEVQQFPSLHRTKLTIHDVDKDARP